MRIRRGARRAGLVSAVGVIGALGLVLAPTLGPSGSAGAVDDTYQCIEGESSPVPFTIPAGVTSVTIEAFGAQGGSTPSDGPDVPGGLGGSTTATLSVQAGDVLYVVAGCAGSVPATPDALAFGPGAGGAGGAGGEGNGASGGDASVVFLNGTDASNVVVVAGGGGGAGTGGGSGIAGGAGGAGSGPEPAVRGDDDDGTTGGEGGGTAGCSNGDSGAGQGSSADQDGGPCAMFPATGGVGGGDNSPTVRGGGGGGGGWQGGGGGGGGVGDSGDIGAGGGGGSGIVRPPAVDTTPPTVEMLRASAIGVNAGNGRVVITYTIGAVPLTVSPRFAG